MGFYAELVRTLRMRLKPAKGFVYSRLRGFGPCSKNSAQNKSEYTDLKSFSILQEVR